MATEQRLIDAEWLKARFYAICDFYATELIHVDRIIYEIDDAPEGVLEHGYWISLTDCSNAGVYCSVCHKKVWKEDYAWCNRRNNLRSNFCPNCGAKMDGGTDETI